MMMDPFHTKNYNTVLKQAKVANVQVCCVPRMITCSAHAWTVTLFFNILTKHLALLKMSNAWRHDVTTDDCDLITSD